MTWIAVLLYATAALAIGWRSHRASKEASDEFWTAGRGLGAASVGLSISAGFMSVSWSCVYAAQLFYWYGLGAIWLITIPWLLSLGGIYFLARRYQALPAFSQPEMVGQRFGVGARHTVALALALVFLVWGGAEIYVAATLLAPDLGVPVPAAILGISLIVGIYATLGGFRAVVATDKLQYAIVAAYVVAIAAITVFAVKGLSGDGLRLLPETSVVASKSGMSWTALAAPGIATILLTFVAYLPGWLFETDLWVRVQAARDDRAARRGVALAGLNAFFFVGVLPLFIGVSALSLFPHDAGAAPGVLGNDGDAIFAALVGGYAPSWMTMLVAVGLVAAAMSTIDTCANVMGLSVAYDLLGFEARPGASRMVTAGAMVACCIFALNTESLWDIFYLSGGILTTSVAFPIAAVFFPWASAKGVNWSARCGFAATIAGYFLESRGPLAALEPEWMAETGLGYILWGLAAALVGYVGGKAAERPGAAALEG